MLVKGYLDKHVKRPRAVPEPASALTPASAEKGRKAGEKAKPGEGAAVSAPVKKTTRWSDPVVDPAAAKSLIGAFAAQAPAPAAVIDPSSLASALAQATATPAVPQTVVAPVTSPAPPGRPAVLVAQKGKFPDTKNRQVAAVCCYEAQVKGTALETSCGFYTLFGKCLKHQRGACTKCSVPATAVGSQAALDAVRKLATPDILDQIVTTPPATPPPPATDAAT